MRSGVLFFFFIALFSCVQPRDASIFECKLLLNDSIQLPFYMSLSNDSAVFSEGTYPVIRSGDSVQIEHPAFASILRFSLSDSSLSGYWYDLERGKYKIQLLGKTVASIPKFPKGDPLQYRCTFTEKDSSTYEAVGLFTMGDSLASGTFLTETGDYRYLTGHINRKTNALVLYTFDFAHAFYFQAELKGDNVIGEFFSGTHYHSYWAGTRDTGSALRDADSIVSFDSGKVNFSFTDLQGNRKSLSDPEFAGKAVIVQVFGSWCPNCYDESRYLNQIADRINAQGILILGLAFEKMPGIENALPKLEKYRSGLNISYPLYYGGVSSKDSASKVLSFLDKVDAYPTLIFLNANHEVIAVHSGFSGPGTGPHYIESKLAIGELIDQLITPQ